jgi:hypothetical protein
MGRVVGCLGRTVLAVVVVIVLGVAWLYRDDLSALWDRLPGRSVRPSPELAAQAEEKLAALGEGGGRTRVALAEDELQSLVEFRWAGFLPPDVVDPRVAVADGRMTLEGGVATARFARITELEEVIAFLPDTTELRAVTSFAPLDSEHVALSVHELGAAGIPVPDRLIPSVLGRFRGSSAPGLPPNALAIPLPPGIRGVYVLGDSLVFLATESGGA